MIKTNIILATCSTQLSSSVLKCPWNQMNVCFHFFICEYNHFQSYLGTLHFYLACSKEQLHSPSNILPITLMFFKICFLGWRMFSLGRCILTEMWWNCYFSNVMESINYGKLRFLYKWCLYRDETSFWMTRKAINKCISTEAKTSALMHE